MLSRAHVVQQLLNLFEAPRYLEVGVFGGDTFFNVAAPHKVAVDPKFQFDISAVDDPTSEFCEVTSDEYFGVIAPINAKFDVIYLDGLHTLEQTLRDFSNAIEYLTPGGVILIDDILPRTYQSSLRTMEEAFAVGDFLGSGDRAWMGDTYKLAFFIDTFFQQYKFCTVEDNEGQLVVWKERRPVVVDRTVESVGRLAFDQLILNYGTLRRMTLDNIIAEFKASLR